MKAVLIKIQVLSLLWVLPVWANDVGLHNSSAQPTRAGSQQDLVQKLQAEFNVDQGNDMLFLAIPEIPVIPLNEVALVALASSNEVRKLSYGVCEFIPARSDVTDTGFFDNQLAPEDLARFLLPKEIQESSMFEESTMREDWIHKIVVKQLREPEHGKMLDIRPEPDAAPYKDRYSPNKGYIGKDRVDFLLEGKDLKGQPFVITVRYYINVIPNSQLDNAIKNDNSYQQALKKYCGTATPTWPITNDDSSVSDASTVLSLNSLAGFDGYDYLAPTYTFDNLPGNSVGQTTGEDANASIVLDTNAAAGYGWFMDSPRRLG